MKVFIVLSAVCLVALAEPPSPHGRFGMRTSGHSASSYSSSSSGGGGGLTDARFNDFGARTPSSEYGTPSNDYSSASSYDAPSTSYGAPSQSYGAPSQSYGAPSNSYGPPSSEYGAPAPSNQYLPPAAPSSQYGAPAAPSQKYGPPAQKYGPPSDKYGAPKSQNRVQLGKPIKSSSFSSRPINAVAAPADSYSRRTEQNNGGPYPSSQGYDDMAEPASYEFKYEVNDAATNQEFGHMESREGDVVTGEYRVLLPDGRTQVVKYVADKDGYRPTIEYLEPNNQQGGYY